MTTDKANSRYSSEQVEFIKKEYELKGNEGLAEIAIAVNKTVNSVRAKLVREKVYQPNQDKYKAKKNGPSKKDIMRELEKLGLTPEGLEGATKPALLNVRNFVVEALKKAA